MSDGSVTSGGVSYKVTPEYLQQASSDTTKTALEIETELAALKAFVASLEDVWGGIAHDQFQVLMADYDTYATMLHNALTGIAGGLQGNYVNYVESEQTNVNTLIALGEDIPAPPTGTNFN
jgi:WXG100 family type VII secretion target